MLPESLRTPWFIQDGELIEKSNVQNLHIAGEDSPSSVP